MILDEHRDPLGQAVRDYAKGMQEAEVLVESDLVEDDVLPARHLFRKGSAMPALERRALDEARGRVLDVGAGAGAHALELQRRGLEVVALEYSRLLCEAMETRGVSQVVNRDLWEYESEQPFDTILLLMNGIGLAGSLEALPAFLAHLKSLLAPGGQILLDSVDLSYLYAEDEDEEDGPDADEDEDTERRGEIQYRMRYGEIEGEWFEWLFLDPDALGEAAAAQGLSTRLIDMDEAAYLACLQLPEA